MRWRLTVLFVAVGLAGSVLAVPGLADEGGGGNNLATPVIFAEGIGLSGVVVDDADYTSTGFPGLVKCGGLEQWGGADGAPYDVSYAEVGTDPTLYQLKIDNQPYLDPLEGQTTAPEGDYYLQPYTLDGTDFGMTTCWEADWADGTSTDMVEVNALDVGDSLVRVLRRESNNPVRVEFVLYQSTETAGDFQDDIYLEGYPMTQLWPPGFSDGKPPSVGSGERQEVWATAVASDDGPVPAELATVYSSNARLRIDKLSWEGLPDSFADGDLDGYPSGVIPDTYDPNYDLWVVSTDVDDVVGGGEGEGGFSAEVNQGGRALYGTNWGLGSGVDDGWYRITLSIDESVDGVDANTLITGLNADDVLADESDGGPPDTQGSKGFFPPTLVEDPDGNYVYVDVYIVPSSGGGKGKMTGKVTTTGGADLAAKLVTVYDATGAPAALAMTSSDGTFDVDVAAGTYYVGVADPLGEYEAEFYDDHETIDDADPVVITDGGTAVVDVALSAVSTDPGDPGDPGEPPVGGDPPFTDVDASNIFHADIEWMWQAGITKGCNPPANDEFCPVQATSRAQIASFFVRALGLTDGADVDRFVDDDGNVHERDINRLAAAGITKGCNPPANDRFCPDAMVTRAQVASMFTRALGLTAGADVDRFVDDDGSIHERDINRLAEAGITLGCNPPANDRFCPGEHVLRQQMAAFFHRALG